MKPIFSIFILLFSFSAFAQFPTDDNGNVSFSEVVEVDKSITAEQMYKSAIEFVATNKSDFNRSNSEKNSDAATYFLGLSNADFAEVDVLFKNDNPLSFSDDSKNKIITNVVTKYSGSKLGYVRVMYVRYSISLQFKDGRYKYMANNFEYTHYNQATRKQTQIYGMKDKPPCGSNGSLDVLLQCNKGKKELGKFYNFLGNDVKALLLKINTSLVNNQSKDEDW